MEHSSFQTLLTLSLDAFFVDFTLPFCAKTIGSIEIVFFFLLKLFYGVIDLYDILKYALYYSDITFDNVAR